MTDPAPQTLEYGKPETQFGVTIEHTPDGGVAVTVPAGHGRRPGVVAVAFMTLLARLFPNMKLPPPRAVVRLTPEKLSITEPVDEGGAGETMTRWWPLREVGEVRPNRYGRGVYVSIPGKDNFDLIPDVDQRLVERVGKELEAALQRLRRRSE